MRVLYTSDHRLPRVYVAWGLGDVALARAGLTSWRGCSRRFRPLCRGPPIWNGARLRAEALGWQEASTVASHRWRKMRRGLQDVLPAGPGPAYILCLYAG